MKPYTWLRGKVPKLAPTTGNAGHRIVKRLEKGIDKMRAKVSWRLRKVNLSRPSLVSSFQTQVIHDFVPSRLLEGRRTEGGEEGQEEVLQEQHHIEEREIEWPRETEATEA